MRKVLWRASAIAGVICRSSPQRLARLAKTSRAAISAADSAGETRCLRRDRLWAILERSIAAAPVARPCRDGVVPSRARRSLQRRHDGMGARPRGRRSVRDADHQERIEPLRRAVRRFTTEARRARRRKGERKFLRARSRAKKLFFSSFFSVPSLFSVPLCLRQLRRTKPSP